MKKEATLTEKLAATGIAIVAGVLILGLFAKIVAK
jgi:hypothetical protein